MVLPAVEHANESLKLCFAAEHGAVYDASVLSHNNLNFRDRDQWVFPYYLPLTDALNGWWQVRVGDGTHGNRVGFTKF